MINELVQRLQKMGVLQPFAEILRKVGLLKLAFRAYEKLQTLTGSHARADLQSLPAREVPIPPAALRVLVAGTPDEAWFLQFGASMFGVIRTMLQEQHVEVEQLSAVLEFGCGCGRVLRYWSSVSGPRLYGVDYNDQLIDWCQRHLSFAEFQLNQLAPPLVYPNLQFDLIYAISVFTHLSLELQIAWLEELKRILKHGGYLLLTTQGESYYAKLTEAEQGEFTQGQVVVRYDEASGMNLCSVYHPRRYMEEQLAVGWSVVAFIPAGTRDMIYQDVYLLRKE